jgi:flavodoxin
MAKKTSKSSKASKKSTKKPSNTEPSKKTEPIKPNNLARFDAYIFGPYNPNVMMFAQIDPWICTQIKGEEIDQAKLKLLNAIKDGTDPRWLYAIEELHVIEAIPHLEHHLSKALNPDMQTDLVKTIVTLDKNHSSFSIFLEILHNPGNETAKIKTIYAIQHLIILKQITQKNLNESATDLFNSLLDPLLKVRTCAYTSLIEYFYDMKTFTSKNDSILNLLEKSENPKDWELAKSRLEDKIHAKKIEPFQLSRVKELLHQIMDRPISIPKNDCEICKQIPDKIDADIAAGESIPPPMDRLDNILNLGSSSNKIKRCPICSRLYLYNYYYSYYLAGQSEEEEHLALTDTKGAINLVEGYLRSYVHPKYLIYSEDFIAFGY